MKTKLFTLLLAVAASVGTMFAESGTCGDNVTWNLDNGVLTISGNGAMTDFTPTGVPWLQSRMQIFGVVINDGVTTIGSSAFESCNNVTSVSIPNSVISINKAAFFGCSGLTSIEIPNSVTSIEGSAFACCRGLTSVTIGIGVTSIGEHAFDGCSSLTSVTIPNSVTSIGEHAFHGCSSLISIDVAPENVNYCSANGVLFNKAKNLLIQYPGGRIGDCIIPSTVDTICGGAFYGCSGLNAVLIPNSVTSIGDDAFSRCTGLTSIDVAVDNLNYSSGNGVLFNKDKTTLIQYPGGKQGEYIIPNSVTQIGSAAFGYCTSLTSVTIPNSVTSIGDGAFEGCSSLTSITIPNSVTSIGEWAFYGCSGLTSVTIPNSVTSIGNDAFYYCGGLTSVTNYAATPQIINNSVFLSVNKSACTLYVPKGSLSTYQAADVWKEFGKIIGIDAPQGIHNLSSDHIQSTKIIRNGQVYILRGEKIYTIDGRLAR